MEGYNIITITINSIRQAGGVPQFLNRSPALVHIPVWVIDNHKINLKEAI